MLPDVIGHENQSQHCPGHRCLSLMLSGRITMPDRFSYHTGQYLSYLPKDLLYIVIYARNSFLVIYTKF